MRNANQVVPDHAAILDTLGRSIPVSSTPAPGSVVRAGGIAQPGPAGLLRAPWSGQPCVWYRTLSVTYPKLGFFEWNNTSTVAPTLDALRSSDLGFPAFGLASVADEESSATLQVVGEFGAVLVDPTRADVDAVMTLDTTEGDYRLEPYTLRREWVIAPGTPLFALGPVQPGPVVRADPVNCAVISMRGEVTAVARSRDFLAAYPAAMAASRRRLGIAFGVGAAVAILVLVVVVVVVLLG